MTEAAGENAALGWGTAVALTLVVLLLSVFDAIPLVALPLALLLVSLPGARRWLRVGLGVAVWALAVLLPPGNLTELSRGWGLLLGGAFLAVSVVRPQLTVLTRGLLALALAAVVSLPVLALGGGWAPIDGLVREHLSTVAAFTMESLGQRAPDAPWAAELDVAAERVATIQWTLFPAVLALQSLAALALASWWLVRMRGGEGARAFRLRPLREFRFNDQLVWLLIAGIALVLLPLGALASRAGMNALLFMGGLYFLRGVGIFLFLAGGAPSFFAIVFGVLATLFLYPVVLTAAVLVGLGDTWLDVRGRAAAAPPST